MRTLTTILRTVFVAGLLATIYSASSSCSSANKDKKSSHNDAKTQVIAQLNLEDALYQLSTDPFDAHFTQALSQATERINRDQNLSDQSYPEIFISEYRKLSPDADFCLVFDFVDKTDSDATIVKKIHGKIRDEIRPSTILALEKRVNVAGIEGEIEPIEDNDIQIQISLSGTKNKKRIKRLFEKKGNLEFFTTYSIGELPPGFRVGKIKNPNNDPALSALIEMLANNPMRYDQYSILGYATSPEKMKAIDRAVWQLQVENLLPGDFILRWSNVPDETNGGYAAYALRKDESSPNKSGAVLTGDVIINAQAHESTYGDWEITIQMNDKGAKRWADITKANIGKPIAEVIDGKVFMAPNVNEQILGGRTSLTGNFNEEEANDIVTILKSGKSGASLEIIEIR